MTTASAADDAGMKKVIPSVPRLMALREAGAMVDNPMAVLREHARRLGPNFHYHFGGVRKVLVTSDPPVLRHVLKDNYDNYPKSTIQVERMVEFIGPGLLTEHGDVWRKRRRTIQHGFRPKSFGKLAKGMAASLDASLPLFDARAKQGPVNLSDEMMGLTFSMAARTLFGAAMDNDEIKAISDAIADVQAFMVRQIIRPYMRPWYAVNGELAKHQAMRRHSDGILRRRIEARRASGAGPDDHDDVLQQLLNAQLEDPEMTDGQVLRESMQLLVAAHETSSTSLAWTMYLLCKHPEHMDAVRNELESVVGEGPLEATHVAQLPLTTRVMKESLRLYPPFWMVDRRPIEPEVVEGILMEPDTTVVCFIHGTHHDPALWPDPERFDPSRFDNDDRRPNLGFTYLPFGGGPKSCIGERYGMLQMLCVLHRVLRAYDFSLADEAGTREQPMFILRPSNGVLAHVRSRLPPGHGSNPPQAREGAP